MCLGSISPPERALLAVSFQGEAVKGVQRGVWMGTAVGSSVAPECVPEEQTCGEVSAEDGVRRFKHRKVLCKGTEVLVSGWLAVVESLCMESETVTVTFPAGGTVRTVPLTDIRCTLTDPLNRDLQTHLLPVFNSVFTFMADMKRCLGTACPVLLH